MSLVYKNTIISVVTPGIALGPTTNLGFRRLAIIHPMSV